VLDRDMIAGHDNAFDKETYESLPTLEVEARKAATKGCGKSFEVVGEVLHASAIHLLRLELLDSRMNAVPFRFEPFATSLEFVDGQRSALVGIDETLHLCPKAT
jgi:hypothetical protein